MEEVRKEEAKARIQADDERTRQLQVPLCTRCVCVCV